MCLNLFGKFVLLLLSQLILQQSCVDSADWNYEPLSIVSYSQDESKMKIDLRVHRLGRDGYVLSGVVDLKFDFKATDKCELHILYSQSGSETDYKPTPFKVPKQPYLEFADRYYQKIIYETLKMCSNFPPYVANSGEVLPQNLYTFDRCNMFDLQGFPAIMSEGFYKVVFRFTGQIEFCVNTTGKVTKKEIN